MVTKFFWKKAYYGKIFIGEILEKKESVQNPSLIPSLPSKNLKWLKDNYFFNILFHPFKDHYQIELIGVLLKKKMYSKGLPGGKFFLLVFDQKCNFHIYRFKMHFYVRKNNSCNRKRIKKFFSLLMQNSSEDLESLLLHIRHNFLILKKKFQGILRFSSLLSLNRK